MREIKFRGKRLNNGEWVYGFVVKNHDDNWFIVKDLFCDSTINPTTLKGSVDIIEVIPESVGEYTGLKDSKNVDIYEGDIVGQIMINGTITNAIIKYFSGGFVVQQIGAEKMSDGLFKYNQLVKVIGNIYENKELLCPK